MEYDFVEEIFIIKVSRVDYSYYRKSYCFFTSQIHNGLRGSREQLSAARDKIPVRVSFVEI